MHPIQTLRQLAHAIKGMLANMGLTPEAEIAKNLEYSCANGGSTRELEAGVDKLTALCAAVRADLHEKLEQI